MANGYIVNPRQLSREMQLRIAAMAEKQARIAELGFPLDEKNWCKLTQGQILIQSLEALELLSEEEQKLIINSYNKLMME